MQLEGERAAALFLPSATASWRLNLLRSGGLPDHRIASLECAPRPAEIHQLPSCATLQCLVAVQCFAGWAPYSAQEQA